MGPARFSIGSSSGLACRNVYKGLIAVCCNPKLYWIPKNPTFMLMIWLNVSLGFINGISNY